MHAAFACWKSVSNFTVYSYLQGGGFMDMFGMMEEMMGNVVSIVQIPISVDELFFQLKVALNKSQSNDCGFICCLCLQERMSAAPNCQTFSSSTVISYSSSGAGAPKVYQQTSQTTTGPGGVRMSIDTVIIIRLLSSFCFVCPDIMRPRLKALVKCVITQSVSQFLCKHCCLNPCPAGIVCGAALISHHRFVRHGSHSGTARVDSSVSPLATTLALAHT